MNTGHQQGPRIGLWRPAKKPASSVGYQWRNPTTSNGIRIRPPFNFPSTQSAPSPPIPTQYSQLQPFSDVTTASFMDDAMDDVESYVEHVPMSNGSYFNSSSTFSNYSRAVEPKKKPLLPPKKEAVAPARNYMISGVSVDFPHDAYPAQISVMEKVLRCLNGNQNGLLESPTGSGKSLALLCSSLAWQSKEYEKNKAAKEIIRQNDAQRLDGKIKRNRNDVLPPIPEANFAGLSPYFASASGVSQSQTIANNSLSATNSCPAKISVRNSSTIVGANIPCSSNNGTKARRVQAPKFKVKPKGVVFDISDDEDDAASPFSSISSMPQKNIFSSVSNGAKSEASVSLQPDQVTEPPGPGLPEKVPRIYFGSRTHKQIAQLVRELRKTSYKNLRMAILGSRDQYCIHPMISRKGNKNEECQQLLDQGKDKKSEGMAGCEYYNGGKTGGPKGMMDKLRKLNLSPVYDIEDLNKFGKKNVICPFFASKDLAKTAQLIFCPYNYLIDARIRSAMDIDLNGAIVIFDEGHNMEDASREASSFILSSVELRNAIDDMLAVISEGHNSNDDGSNRIRQLIRGILRKFRALIEWMESFGRNITTGLQGGSKEITGEEIGLHLQQVGLGVNDYADFLSACDAIKDDKQQGNESDNDGYSAQDAESPRKVSGPTMNLIRSLVVVLGYMYRMDKCHLPDYRILMSKETHRNLAYLEDSAGYRRKRQRDEVNEYVLKLNFWCLNPGVAFQDFLVAKSIVLTSGTLSPITSFQSELGIKFGVQFEANHVIAMNQVWAAGVGKGPKNTMLTGTYNFVSQLSYQDDVGAAIVRICHVVPKGVLCFFTSYKVLDNLLLRWQMAGLLEQIESRKVILQEPRNSGGDKSVFENTMEKFYSAIRGESLVDGQDGAIMFAVYRGKISEGLDFADDNARAVIAVGIPYPNLGDEQVKMKREYNDKNRNRGLLSGSDWYDIQAFRALNQALGRCLRHKHDWGALILLDSRFVGQAKFIQGLSKWLRPQIKPNNDFNVAMASLDDFIRRRLALVAPPVEEATHKGLLGICAPLPLPLPSPAIDVITIDDNLTEDEISSWFSEDDSSGKFKL